MGAHYPTVRGVGAFQGGAASLTHTIGGTSGISEPGDLILIFLESANQTFTAPVGGGYLALGSSPQGIGANPGAANATRLTIFYKIATGAETTYVTGDSGDHNIVCSLVIANVDIANPINVTAGNTATAATAITFPAVTTTVPECLVINAVTTDRDINNEPYFTNIVNANLANITQRVNRTFNTGQGGGIGVFTGQKATAGTTGSTTASQPVSEETARITLAIAPLRRRIAIT
jgi:hypothetical protein